MHFNNSGFIGVSLNHSLFLMNKTYFFLIGLICLVGFCNSKNTTSTETSIVDKKQAPPPPSDPTSLKYDSLLAKRLGTDEHGMRKYAMAFKKKVLIVQQHSKKRNCCKQNI